MKPILLLAVLVAAIACADRVAAPTPTRRSLDAGPGRAIANECVEFRECGTPAPDTFVIYPCHWELRYNERGQLGDTLVCS